MNEKNQPQPQNLKVEVPNEEGFIKYSNFVIVSHSPEELVIDFARIMPGQEGAKVVSRIVMTPKNAKMFMKALENNIENFEKKFGDIALPDNVGFNTPGGVIQ
ncbi:MAG: DUF3467 domain-containing protein [Brevinematales bacterium]|jgi:hypothetical protein|nr:DUF3467 domain-containing protein [Brevinematales bacterium]OHD54461.1 MAG: hypothetical protein A2014_05680 [Spirochaetes bacterium GWF1_49_6]